MNVHCWHAVHQRPSIRSVTRKVSIPVKITGTDTGKKKDGRDGKRAGRGRGETTGNEQLREPLSVTSGIALCAEKPLRQRSHYHRHANPKRYKRVYAFSRVYTPCTSNTDTRAWTHVVRVARRGKYEYYHVVYTSSLARAPLYSDIVTRTVPGRFV